jgi:HSP20 family protein
MFITTLNQNRNNLIDEMIDDIFRIYPNAYRHNSSSDYKTDSDEDGVTLTINVPGYNDKLIDVSVSGDRLTIEGKSHTGSTEGFNHTFTINDNLDADGIEATVIDGVLTVSVPYAEEVKPRKIKVKVK